MGIRFGFNPSAPHSGMGEKFAGPGGQGAGMPENIFGTSMVNPFATQQNQIGWQGYNPTVIAAGIPSVNTGNDNYAIPNFPPSQWGTLAEGSMPITPTDWYSNPTSGWESFPAGTYPGGGAYGFPAQMNPAFNIDNITQPASFAGYPNQTGIPTGGYVGAPYVNPASMPIGGGLDVGSGGGYNGGGREGAGRD